MEMNNVDETMGLDALLSLANGLPSHDSSLEDPLAMSAGDWVTSGCHGNEYGEGEKDLEDPSTGPSLSTFTSVSEEIQPVRGVASGDSSFSRQD